MSECNICYANSKVIKCKKCNFFICRDCLIRLDNEMINDKINYNCCVCKSINVFNIKNLQKNNLIKLLNQKNIIPKSIQIVNYNETPIIVFNIPVFSNKIKYHNTNIILIKTIADYNYIHYTSDTDLYNIPIQKLIYEDELFTLNSIKSIPNYYFYKCFNESEYGLIEDHKLYNIIQYGYVENDM
jgi:hypothetical protein